MVSFTRRIQKSVNLIGSGFPRNMDNLSAWLGLTSGNSADGLQVVQHGVLFIDCSDAEMQRRLVSRGRADDTAAIIHTRITEGHKEFAPVITHFLDRCMVSIFFDVIYVCLLLSFVNISNWYFCCFGSASLILKLFRVDGDQSVQAVYADVKHILSPVLSTYRSSS